MEQELHTDNNVSTPTIRERILALLTVPVAAGAFGYVTCGRGFVWDPWAYTVAWLTLIAALAYGIPMLDVTIDTCAAIWHRTKRAIRTMRRALAGVHDRHDASASMRPVRVVRSTTHMEAGR